MFNKQKANKLFRLIPLNPPQILVLSFLSFILIGGVLLHLPIAHKVPVSWIDAMFTATSATTVTGLTVVNIHSTYTIFGQVVMLILMQIGGLGLLLFAVLILIMLGRKIGLKERIVVREQLQTPLGGIIRLIKRIALFVFIIEGSGILLLASYWVPQMGWAKGIYYSIFHIIAAFNNAGFALWPDNLSRFVGDPVVNLIITAMIIAGGLGFTVLSDLWFHRSWGKFSLHSKMMLAGTLAINVIAILIIFMLEHNNPATLGSLSLSDQWWAAYFQAITSRTAGFMTVPIGQLHESTQLFMMMLMFIGAGSVSAGGGIKLTTFLIIILAVITFLRRKKEPSIFKKRIKQETIHRALAVTITSLTFIFLAVFLLTMTQDIPLKNLLFETISAFGTVGLSTGITAQLTTIGKLIIMCVMFLGLVGPLSIVLSISEGQQEKIRYPSEDVLTG